MATPYGFETAQPKQLPYWLRDEQGAAFEASFGRAKDDGLALYREASAARWPTGERPDALPYQGSDRLTLRAPPETDAEYALRLEAAPDTWQWGGTPTGIVGIFAPYGYTAANLAVVPNHQVILDGNMDWFSRFIVLADASYWEADEAWDATVSSWADSTDETWDSSLLMSDIDYARASIRIMKSDESYPVVLGIRLVGAAGDGFWDSLPITLWDVGSETWTDAADDAMYIPLGHVWEEHSWLGGTDTWDSSGDDVYDVDPLYPPSYGWASVP